MLKKLALVNNPTIPPLIKWGKDGISFQINKRFLCIAIEDGSGESAAGDLRDIDNSDELLIRRMIIVREKMAEEILAP